MTKAETLAALERAEKATPGKWEARGRGGMSDGGSSRLHAHFRGDIMAGKRSIISSSSLLGVTGETPKLAKAHMEDMKALKSVVAIYRNQCSKGLHYPLRHPLCRGCQVDARMEEAAELLRRYEGKAE